MMTQVDKFPSEFYIFFDGYDGVGVVLGLSDLKITI